MEDDRIRAPRRCNRYVPGHEPHFIQANKASADHDTKVPGTVVRIDDTGIVVETEGETVTFLNHDLDRARDLLGVLGPEVTVQRRWSLLRFGTYVVCIQADRGTPLDPCEVDDEPEGGFLARPSSEEDLAEFAKALHRPPLGPK